MTLTTITIHNYCDGKVESLWVLKQIHQLIIHPIHYSSRCTCNILPLLLIKCWNIKTKLFNFLWILNQPISQFSRDHTSIGDMFIIKSHISHQLQLFLKPIIKIRFIICGKWDIIQFPWCINRTNLSKNLSELFQGHALLRCRFVIGIRTKPTLIVTMSIIFYLCNSITKPMKLWQWTW